MCGIIGVCGLDSIGHKALNGLEQLEYRGYDSAGFASSDIEQDVTIYRTLDGVSSLTGDINSIESGALIGHSRWATHGEVSLDNAHPHNSGDEIAIVHNGIIENHKNIRDKLSSIGVTFRGTTDTESIVHNIRHHYKGCWKTALLDCVSELEGAWGISMVVKGENNIYFAKNGSPLIIGIGDGENYLSSSIDGINHLTSDFYIMDDMEFGMISHNSIEFFDVTGNPIDKSKHHIDSNSNRVDIGSNESYMIKEIEEQPDVITNTILSGDHKTDNVFGLGASACFRYIKSVQIIACGTSFNAGSLGKYWIEENVGIRCGVEIASEFVYRKTVESENELFIFISQSGETADTIAAIKKTKKDHPNSKSLAICNSKHSELVRLSDFCFITRAGVEIGVASTKAFTTQLIGILVLMEHIIESVTGVKGDFIERERIPMGINHIIDKKAQIFTISKEIATYKSCLFIGRGVMYPIAVEGALKLKEISYIHAEAYAGGELKHGPIALIDENMPVIALSMASSDSKMISNVEEVRARGGLAFVFDECGHNKIVSPILMSVFMQILSYQVTKILGLDTDKPRNLAKSVTVE